MKKKESSSCNTNNNQVAIKFIDISSDLSRSYAVREIQILSKLDHPYCTKMIEVIDFPEKCTKFIVMTLGEGPTIHSLIKRGGAFGLPLAKYVSRQLIEVIAYLHSHAVLHRDIKPENCILVGADLSDEDIWSDGDNSKKRVEEGKWNLMLVDFGFSRALLPKDLSEKKEDNWDNTSNQISQNQSSLSNIDAALLESKISLSHTNDVKSHQHRFLLFGKGEEKKKQSRKIDHLKYSYSNVDVLELSAIGSKNYAAPEMFQSMKKNNSSLPNYSDIEQNQQKSCAEYVSKYSMAVDAYSLGKFFAKLIFR